MAKDEWEKIETEMWLPEHKDEVITGEITKIDQGLYGLSYSIKVESGKEIRLPSHKVLQGRLSTCKIGDEIKVVYKGEEAPKVKGQNPMRMYEVFRKK